MEARTVPASWAASFYASYFGVLGVVLPFLGPFLRDRGLGDVAVGLVIAAFSLAKLVYAPCLGVLVDRGLWFRGLLSVHMTLSVLCALAVLWLRGPWSLGMAFLVAGLGYGTVLPLVEATVLERLPAVGYGVLRLWGSVGFVVVAALSGRLLVGERMAGFPLVFAAVLAALTVSCWPFESAARPRRQTRRERLPFAVWLLLGILTLHQVSHGPYYAFFSIHLMAKGMSSLVVGAMWSLGVVAELGAFLFGRRLERWLGLRRLLTFALAMTPIRWLLLALPVTWPTLVTAQIGHAVTFALVHLTGVQLIQLSAPKGSVRYAQALYSGLCFGFGIVAGTALAGPLYTRIQGHGSFAAAAVFSFALFLCWMAVAGRISPASGKS